MNTLAKLLAAADNLAAAADIYTDDPEPDRASPSAERLADAMEVYKTRRTEHLAGEGRKAAPKAAKEPSEEATRFASWARRHSPAIATEGQLRKWALCFDDLVQRDGYTAANIAKIWTFAREHDFFKKVVLSPLKLRQTDNQGVRWIERLADAMRAASPSIPAGQVPLRPL